MNLSYNDGRLFRKIVNKYTDNKRESSFYDQSGDKYQHIIETLDEKGFSIEETHFFDKPKMSKFQSRSHYEFDNKGNWIKRVVEYISEKDGKQIVEPGYVRYRNITYY